MSKKTIIYCDGGARGNPGPAASAFLVIENSKIVEKDSKYLGKTTNNIAEYRAVEMAYGWLNKNVQKKSTVHFFLDSRLVVNQLNGNFKVKNEALKKMHHSIKGAEKKLELKVFYNYIPREKNVLADLLVNERLDMST